jgi:hypothetical protein
MKFSRSFLSVIVLLMGLLLITSGDLLARRGGGGGGSFGGSRSFSSSSSSSYSRPSTPSYTRQSTPSVTRSTISSTRPSVTRSTSSGGSIGGVRTRPTPATASSPTYTRPALSSRAVSPSGQIVGANRVASTSAYTSRYGSPRAKSYVRSGGTTIVVNRYGGYGDSYTSAYLAGQRSVMWSMPFHPAFYYSRPTYVTMPNGQTQVYPSTFQWGTLLLTVLGAVVVVGGTVYLIRRARANRLASSF